MASPRNLLLALALAATVVASLVDFPFAEPQAGDVVASAPKPAANAAVPDPAAQSSQPAPPVPRARHEAPLADLFAPRSWQPPPPPPTVPIAAAPKAPPLPFLYLGKVMQDGDVTAFLGQGTRTHLLRKGDVVADYKIDEITAAGMTLVYLPLNEKQRLAFGSTN